MVTSIESRVTDALPGKGGIVDRVRLRVVAGADEGTVYESTRERTVIGTHRSADLVLSDATVSRFHCEITLGDGRAVVRDLGSKNGTRVDGVAVLAAPITEGAILTAGRTQLRFELAGDKVRLEMSSRERFGRLVGRSPLMRAAFERLERAAASDVTVLLTGETGTGKDAAAESLHLESARKDGPFVIVDLASLPGGLAETELFGHEKGAFTGATSARAGAFEAAAGGTVFLDEVGELGRDLQPKLLRALEQKTIQRVGSNQRVRVDVRIVAATNRDLKAEVNERRFRSDLYYRLAVLEVRMPPLRERAEDVALLVEELLAGMSVGDEARELRSPAFLASLLRHPWPGNVRELKNHLERCLAVQSGLPAPDSAADAMIDPHERLRVARDRWIRFFEKRYLAELLKQHGGNVSAAARAAGVDRIHFYRLLSRAGLR